MIDPINKEGLDLIKECEGLRLKAYQDQGGIWTIGYGETEGVRPGMEITKEEADKKLLSKLGNLRDEMLQAVHLHLSENQIGALLSLVYNIGFGNFFHSTLLRLINESLFLEASHQFLVWDKVHGKFNSGLNARRQKERALFLK